MASSKSKISADESSEEPPTAKFSKKTKSSKYRKKCNSYEIVSLLICWKKEVFYGVYSIKITRKERL